MSRVLHLVPRVAIFLAGIAAGALAGRRERTEAPAGPAEGDLRESIKESLNELEARMEARLQRHETSVSERFQQVETRLEEHAAKLADVPSTAQIVAAMEQILARSMSSLDERLANQAHSIEVLRTTVSQTDGLLERVLESLDSFQAYTDPGELVTDSVFHRPTV
jgi:chromosome segregation ATPase